MIPQLEFRNSWWGELSLNNIVLEAGVNGFPTEPEQLNADRQTRCVYSALVTTLPPQRGHQQLGDRSFANGDNLTRPNNPYEVYQTVQTNSQRRSETNSRGNQSVCV